MFKYLHEVAEKLKVFGMYIVFIKDHRTFLINFLYKHYKIIKKS